MKLQLFTVDAFTDQPFSGNPAAVIPLTQVVEEEVLQRLAEELNLSETAYVSPKATPPATTQEDPWVRCSRFTLRWFTPTTEVPLCGHATLATAHVLFHCLGNLSSRLEFETQSGVLVARREGHHIVLDFPANPPVPLTALEETQLARLLKVVTGDLQVKHLLLSHTTKKLLVSLHACTREQLETLQLDTGAILDLHDGSLVKGVIFTTRGTQTLASSTQAGELDPSEYHCVSRYFAPWNGIPEDPVTGSAHTVLGPYWSKELGITTLRCRQCSARGGDVRVTVRPDGRVDLAGRATTLIQGYITL
nr:phenazine biosynthesis-like domain-containing protein [Procambarus clarkii]XP_045623169.1 phenazine biosynthesis-like domain-containing protein [Procambarus clarkii]XP_045623170.1 phenazine biosynthesis-like domain-containing protein [Procambarus clarkii]